MITAMYREEALLYGDTPEGAFPPLDLPPGRSVFLVARSDGEAIGCGAVIPHTDDAGEVKRIYVEPAWRGRRVASRVLAELERRAVGMGYQRLRLETGIYQPAAIRLYERSGFRPIPCYGRYAGDPLSVCFEKVIAGS
jgi:GNAT superfamily N-acetyltransferase